MGTALAQHWAWDQTAMGRSDEGRHMSRELVWIKQQRFAGWGCSECDWFFNPPSALAGKSYDELVQNFALQRDKEFTSHVCSDHPRANSTRSKNAEQFKLP
jgi:hypothetical protein